MNVGRVNLSGIGKALCGQTTAKARIQWIWGFTSNPRVVVSDAIRSVVAYGRKRKPKKPLLIAFDWIEIRQFHRLMAAAVMLGRAMPLL